jgi:hypothetical protein
MFFALAQSGIVACGAKLCTAIDDVASAIRTVRENNRWRPLRSESYFIKAEGIHSELRDLATTMKYLDLDATNLVAVFASIRRKGVFQAASDLAKPNKELLQECIAAGNVNLWRWVPASLQYSFASFRLEAFWSDYSRTSLGCSTITSRCHDVLQEIFSLSGVLCALDIELLKSCQPRANEQAWHGRLIPDLIMTKHDACAIITVRHLLASFSPSLFRPWSVF